MIETSQNVDALFKAIHTAQGNMRGVGKDSANPHFKNRYASLENVVDTARPALQSADLAFTQAPGALVDGAIEVTTMLMHTSGQWLRSTLHVPLQKRDPQGVGSAITYGCRYALMATLGLPPVDDDGEDAMDRTPPAKAAPAATVKQDRDADRSQAFKMLKAALICCLTAEQVNEWADQPTNRAALGSLSDDEFSVFQTRITEWRAHVAKKVAA